MQRDASRASLTDPGIKLLWLALQPNLSESFKLLAGISICFSASGNDHGIWTWTGC